MILGIIHIYGKSKIWVSNNGKSKIWVSNSGKSKIWVSNIGIIKSEIFAIYGP